MWRHLVYRGVILRTYHFIDVFFNEVFLTISDDVFGVSLEPYSLQCISGTLKKYLRELPNPVIPEEHYNQFIQAASKYKHYLGP